MSKSSTDLGNEWSFFGLRPFCKDIKISHSIFALPFAASIFFIADLPIPTAYHIFWLLCCMVGARSFSMGVNRFLDRDIDFENERTKNRALPSGQLKSSESLFWTGFSALIFVFASFQLSQIAGWLSVPLLLVLMAYSHLKKLSYLCHLYLGICLGLSPVAVVVALGGEVSLSVLLLCAAITFWTAGFDVIYSLQDREYDRGKQLHSIPVKFGVGRSLWVSRLFFGLMIILLAGIGMIGNKGAIYFLGVGVIALILSWEHMLVRSWDGTSKKPINSAFFTSNAWISVIFLAFCLMDSLLL